MLTDGILDQLAKYERAKAAEKTHRSLLQKTREGKVIRGPKANYSFKYNDTEDGLQRHWVEGDADPALRRSPIMYLGGQLLIVVHWHCLSSFHSGVWCSRSVATFQHRLPAIYELAGSAKATQRIPCCMVFHS